MLVLAFLPSFVGACGDSPSTNRVPEWTTEEELRIGSRDDGEQALTEVPFLTVDASGNIYVAQPLDRGIRVFSPNGELLRVLGGPGEGPGEFKGIDALGLLGDTLYVSDTGNRRVTYFGPDGTLLKTAPFNWPSIDGLFGPRRVDRILSDGTVLVDPSFGSPNVAAGIITARPLLKMDMAGNVLLRLAEISVKNRVLAAVRGNRGLITAQPFADFPLLGFSRADDFVVILTRDAAKGPSMAAMHFFKVTASGDTVVSVDIPYDPVVLPPATVERVVDELASTLSESGPFETDEFAREVIRDAVYRPAYYPPASELVLAQEGGVLVRREDLGEPLARWDVLSAEGTLVASIILPGSTKVHFATDTHLWATDPDELDVTYVVRYRILRD
jgi:hypothetical protein